ncbi:MAG: right-handed parallel beta-helix repeat-containing protein [gamma proteobacterium endosymbiont of Lamellibrachia anaximandri]|nr:right-handed parallel beta-helix repeat-containing protein [gamma proteobacterium endosymbiont of Lamellibrachia anaximandri]MBL3617485.1 right-handed parallel beta-helix repeat-containing protein [gamma proteobacterium endosymbiont of Lamellibrachia anaximandri]
MKKSMWNLIKAASMLCILSLPISYASGGDYTMPVGIPAPSFGLNETHEMYQGQYYAAGDFTYRDAGDGPYSHYIDNSSSACTDDGNEYGTAETPRCTVPNTLPEGTVVEVHGGPYLTGGTIQILGEGTPEKPVFLRGISPENRTLFAEGVDEFRVRGEYFILENMEITKTQIDLYRAPNHHISFRGNEIHGYTLATETHSAMIALAGWNGNQEDNIVFFNNEIHHAYKYDDPVYGVDHTKDNHGLVIGADTHHVWILNNHMHHNGGDSVQLRGTNLSHVYIGGNEMHDDVENAIDVKSSEHVIVSQNIMHGYVSSFDSDGTVVVGGHEGSKLTWFLFNEIYDGRVGLRVNDGVPTTAYVIGNKMHHLLDRGFETRYTSDIYFIGNSISETPIGFEDNGSGTNTGIYKIHNNIFYTNNDSSSQVIISSGKVDGGGTNSFSHNLLYSPGGNVGVRWGDTVYQSSALLQSATGMGEGNIEADPHYTSLTAGDPNIMAINGTTFPGASKGTLSTDVAAVYQAFEDLYGIDIRQDYAGTSLPQGTGVEIGAYEISSPPPPTNLSAEVLR